MSSTSSSFRVGTVNDVLTKLRFFETLHAAIAKQNVKDRMAELKKAFESMSAPMVPDGYMRELEKLRSDFHGPVKEFLDKYDKFKQYVAGLRSRGMRPLDATRIDGVKRSIDDALEHYEKRKDQGVGTLTSQYKSSSYSDDPKYYRGNDMKRRIDKVLDELKNMPAGISEIAGKVKEELGRTFKPVSVRRGGRSSRSLTINGDRTEAIETVFGGAMESLKEAMAKLDDVKSKVDDPLLVKLSDDPNLYFEITGAENRSAMMEADQGEKLALQGREELVKLKLDYLYQRMLPHLTPVVETGLRAVQAALSRTTGKDKRDLLGELVGAFTALRTELLSGGGGSGSGASFAPSRKAAELNTRYEARFGGGQPLGEVHAASQLPSLLPGLGPSGVTYTTSGAASSFGSARAGAGGTAVDPFQGGDADGGGGAPPFRLPSFMYRKPDLQRMNAYSRSAAQWEGKLAEHRMAANVSALKMRLADRVNKLNASMQEGGVVGARDAVGLKVAAANAFLKQVLAQLQAYIQAHAGFALKAHRSALAYIRFWNRSRAALSQKEAGEVDRYIKIIAHIATDAQAAVQAVGKEVEEALRMDGGFAQGISDDQTDILRKALDDGLDQIEAAGARIQRMYSGASAGDILRDPQYITLYVVKAARFLVALYALKLAARVFQARYNDVALRAGGTGEPPSPHLFLWLALALQMVFELLIVCLLLLLRHMFKTPANTFPVDTRLLVGYGVDYLCVTVLAAAIGTIVAEVVRRKKYFRYRHEGDRGVRAMHAIMGRVFAVALALPFFRFAEG